MNDEASIQIHSFARQPTNPGPFLTQRPHTPSQAGERGDATLLMTASSLRDEEAVSNVVQSVYSHDGKIRGVARRMVPIPASLEVKDPGGEERRLRTIVENISIEASTKKESSEACLLPQSEGRRQKQKPASHDGGRTRIRRSSWRTSEKLSGPVFASRNLSSDGGTISPPRAAVPPFAPPEHMTTPTGLPRWSHDVRKDRRPTTSKRRMIFTFLRHGRSTELFFRRVVAGTGSRPLPAVSPGSTWRPPPSGHSTHMFANLSAHPFASRDTIQGESPGSNETEHGSSSDKCRSSSSLLHTSWSQRRSPKMRSSRDASHRPPTTASSSACTNQGRALCPSQAALQALGGNAIPIRDLRHMPRTASVPKDRRMLTPPPPRTPHILPGIHMMNAVNEIGPFPDPSSTRDVEQRGRTSQCERSSTIMLEVPTHEPSIFRPYEPRIQPHVCNASTLQKSWNAQTPTVSPVMQCLRTKSTSEGLVQFDSLQQGNLKTVSGTQGDDAVSTRQSLVVASAKDAHAWSLYQPCHAKVFGGPQTASHKQSCKSGTMGFGNQLLRQNQNKSLLNAENPGNDTSVSMSNLHQSIANVPTPHERFIAQSQAGAHLHILRHKSAATGSRIASKTQHRSFANNTTDAKRKLHESNDMYCRAEMASWTRFRTSNSFSGITTAQVHDDRTPETTMSNDENTMITIPSTLIPVTVTSAALSPYLHVCKHGRALVPSAHPPQPFNLDGPPPSTTSRHTNTHSRPANAGSLAQQGLLRGLTWRSRMSRVKCWRCELESTGQKGLGLVKEMLSWTCFCRFKGYDLESDSETEREEEMHRRQAEIAGSGSPRRN
nr:hypothetical protein CFP56_00431 [Quercus suber]